MGDVCDDPCPPLKPRINVICEALLSDIVPGVLGSYLDSGEGDFSCESSRRRPKKKNHSPAAARAPTPNKQPITIPAMAPPLKDDDFLPVLAEPPGVWAGPGFPTVTVICSPDTVRTETVGAAVVESPLDVELAEES